MDESPETELGRRLRANRGRKLRPEFTARIERAFGFEPEEEDFLDLPETDRLQNELLARLRELQPVTTRGPSRRGKRSSIACATLQAGSARSTRPTWRSSAVGSTSERFAFARAQFLRPLKTFGRKAASRRAC